MNHTSSAQLPVGFVNQRQPPPNVQNVHSGQNGGSYPMSQNMQINGYYTATAPMNAQQFALDNT